MSIAALALWMFTAAAGWYLLIAAIAARRAADPPAPASGGPAPVPGGRSAGGRPVPPPIPHTRVTAAPGEHPLLEFCHPALAILGLACWLAYVATGDAGFSLVAFGVLVAAIGAGMIWLGRNMAAAWRRHGEKRNAVRRAPVHLIVVHGLAAAATFALAVTTVLAVARL